MGRKKKQTDIEDVKIGHNGGPISDERKKQLAGYVSEIERWEGEKATIQADIGQIFAAAKESGFDTKAMRVIIKDRKKSRAERDAFEAVCDAYKHALGMLADLPLGQAAMPRQEAAPAH